MGTSSIDWTQLSRFYLKTVQILCFGHYPSSCLCLKHHPVYFSKHDVSQTGFCLRLQVKPTQLGPIDRASPSLRTPMPACVLKNKQDVVLDKDKTMDNVQNTIFVLMYHRHKLLDLIY
jgi:hypothetical protein